MNSTDHQENDDAGEIKEAFASQPDGAFSAGEENFEGVAPSPGPDARTVEDDPGAAPAGDDDICWGDNVVELPAANLFRAAFEKMILPEIECGKPFECVIRLFTRNNDFGRKILLTGEPIAAGSPDFSVQTNPAKDAILIRGTAKKEGVLKIKIPYAVKSSFPAFAGKDNFVEKVLTISPDPVRRSFRDGVHKVFAENAARPDGLSSLPSIGTAGTAYEGECDISGLLSLMDGRIRLERCAVCSESGEYETEMSADIGRESGRLFVHGMPSKPEKLFLNFFYSLKTDGGEEEGCAEHPLAAVAPNPALVKADRFVAALQKLPLKRGVAGAAVSYAVPLPAEFDPSCMAIVSAVISDPQLNASYLPEKQIVEISGTPTVPGSVGIHVVLNVLTGPDGETAREFDFRVMELLPDPKTLWRNLQTDPDAPYQSPDEEHVVINAGDRTILAASKRGRSHAHDGKFRDDNFKVDYIESTGWFIIGVSDGAGSAKFSREGSRIACHAFWEVMRGKLSSAEVNARIDAMERTEQEDALKNAVLNAAYQALSRIDAEAKRMAETCPTVTRKDYSATFLGYVMKRFEDAWLIVSIGIGDGIIAMLDKSDGLTLLSEPDGGEFVGQTRFLTMNEVWLRNPISRTRAVRTGDFGFIMSMTDGVSDPKFETDNNLKDQRLWLDLRNDIAGRVPLDGRSDETALKMSEWLDFWAKGNHDDRTIVLVY